MKLSILSIFTCLAIFILACSTEEKKQIGNFSNPNGDSELALLMREMCDDAMLAKQKIERGETTKLAAAAEKMFTVRPTEPEKQASPEFKVFADSYLSAVKILENSAPAESPEHFKNVVTACINCHESLCPGPVKRIKKLYPENGN